MTKVIRNTIANSAGNLVSPILLILFVPIYIKYLGLEGYGFIGFFGILITLLSIFTNGFGSSLQREIAIRDSSREHQHTLRRLVRTFELAYWAAGSVLALCLISLSDKISSDWINVNSMPIETVRLCIILVSLRVALSFPNGIYQAVLLGTQHQVLNNILKSVTALIAALLGVVVVVIWKSIVGFYAIDIIGTLLTLLILRYYTGKILPSKETSSKTSFEWYELEGLLFFSLGLIWTNGIAVIVSQIDRIIISKLLPLAMLGVYNIAVAGSIPLTIISGAIFTAFFPQICQVSQKDCKKELGSHLIYASKLLMIISMMVGLPLIFFSSNFIEIWTGNKVLVEEGPNVMSFYVLGSIFASYASILYMGQLALRITRFVALYTTIALLWLTLVVWILVSSLGLIGAALGWMIYCISCWIFHIVVICFILKDNFPVKNYLILFILTSVSGISITYLTKYLSLLYFNDSSLGGIFFAVLGSGVTFLVCYIICFGFQIFKEIDEYIINIKYTNNKFW